jgi:hypothetical protein
LSKRFFFTADAALLLRFRQPHLFAHSTERQRDPLVSLAPPRLIKSSRHWTAHLLPDAAGRNAQQT